MGTKQGITVGAVALAGLLALSVAPAARGDMEESAFTVSMGQFQGILQELRGHAVTLTHYVGKERGSRQERIGYQVVLDQSMERMRALEQERLGLQFLVDHQARMRAEF